MKTTLKTYYFGPTNTTGSKITAKAFGRQVSVSYDYSLSLHDAHKKAAQAFADKHGFDPVADAIDSHSRGYAFALS
tara:strand:- start:365 stop:592 length:228 start_codon:yes stop_codon:yes gene_type:complete